MTNNRPCYILVILIALLVAMGGCASNGPHSPSKSSSTDRLQQPSKVLVINSNQSIDRYEIAEREFVSSLQNYELVIVNLEKEQQPIEQLQDILNQQDFDVIYCIGAKALGSIDYISPDLPVVYTAVLNWRKFKNHANYFGISSELSPEVQLTWMKYFFKERNKIGVFYSEENASLIADAQSVSQNLSLELKPIMLAEGQDLLKTAEPVMPDLDALWLISDSHTLSSTHSVADLFALADRLKVPVFTYNPLFIDYGAVMSFAADLPTTARQAALMTMKLLDNKATQQAIQFPAGSRIILNRERLRRYQMKLNPGVLDSVDELR